MIKANSKGVDEFKLLDFNNIKLCGYLINTIVLKRLTGLKIAFSNCQSNFQYYQDCPMNL